MEVIYDTCIDFEGCPEEELIKTMDPTNKFRWAVDLSSNPTPELQQAWRSRYTGEHYWVPVPITLLNAEVISDKIQELVELSSTN